MHRNIANIVSATDVNTSAVIEYAVGVLKVQEVLLCGHSACGGAGAALDDLRPGGNLELWLKPLRALRIAHREELDAAVVHDKDSAIVRMAELNVEAGVKILMANVTVQEAVRKRGLEVHGTMYDLASGVIRNLGVGTDADDADAGARLSVGVAGLRSWRNLSWFRARRRS